MRKRFMLLTNRAKNCAEQLDALMKVYPGMIHSLNAAKYYVMAGWTSHYHNREPLTTQLLDEWEKRIIDQENRLEKMAKRL